MIAPPDQDPRWLAKASDSSLRRLLPGLKRTFEAEADPAEWNHFEARLREHFMRFFSCFHALYGHQYDFFYHLGEVVHAATASWHQRPGEPKALDTLREVDPGWYASRRMVGAMCYVDLFAGDLQGIRDRIPYLEELGITDLHLMPVYDVQESDHDGGDAVRSFREIRPELGTMDDLRELATELRHHGISLVLDFVLNHTSDEHEWAKRALRGEEEYQDYYRTFDDRTLPEAYEGVEVVGFDPDAHRRFLTDFYTGRFPGSYARRAPFMENPLTRDARVSGMLASLCRLEKALDEGDAHEVELSVHRILLLHGIVITLGGHAAALPGRRGRKPQRLWLRPRSREDR